jgi:hypothetical protein
MAVFYNTNGTVSQIVVNAIINGKVTSSLVTAPNIQQSIEASASNAIISASLSAGSSSVQAYNLAYPTGSPNNAGYTYLSSRTIQRKLGTYVQYPWPTGSAASGSPLYSNGVLVSSSQQANEVLYGSGLSNYGNQNYWNTTASLVINKITNEDRAALGLPSVGAHSLPIFYSTASWADLGNSSLYSASIATGSIMKLSISRSYFDFTFDSGSATKLSLVSSNIHSNLNSFNTLSGSVSASVEYSHFVLFVSSSRALMGTLISEKTYISKPI